MRRLWWFNPENDIALAAGSANFTAPPAANIMRIAGEFLPLFLADVDDALLCNGVNNRWFDEFRERFGLTCDIWNHNPDGFSPSPWGWSYYTRRFFKNNGFTDNVLPTDKELERWRQLSHRRTAAAIYEHLRDTTTLPLWPKAQEITDADSLRAIKGRLVIKSPWSSSGRGVIIFDSQKSAIESFIVQTKGTIRRQGSVMVEEYMEGHRDFALLYDCKDGYASFAGPSIFIADKNSGKYIGNLVASDEELFEHLCKIISPDCLNILIKALSNAISAIIAPGYDGPVGVDICCNDEFIHICETNLRYTMGFVARGIAERTSTPSILSAAITKPEGAISLTPPGCQMSFILREKDYS